MAGTGSAIYNGVTIPVPGVVGFVDPSGLTFPVIPGAPVVYLIGDSVGGQPNTVLGPFSTYKDAAAVLQGGDLLDGVRYVLKVGASQVACYRPYSATQSSLTLKDANGNPSIILTSVDYGSWTNALLASISGTPGNITATVVDNYHGTSYSQSGLGPVLTVAYTGNATTAVAYLTHSLTAPSVSYSTTSTTGGSIPAGTTVYVKVVPRNASGIGPASAEASGTVGTTTSTNTITFTWPAEGGATSYDVYASSTSGSEVYYGNVPGAASGNISVTITSIPSGTAPVPTTATAGPNFNTWLSGQTDGSKNIDLSLSNPAVTTARGLAAYLQGQFGYTASLYAGQGNVQSSQLDPVSGGNLLGSGIVITSDLGAVVDWFNTTGVVTAAAAPGATNAPAAVGLTPFVGGSDGSTSVSSWQAAANQIQTFNPLLRYVVPLTSNPQYMQAVNSAILAAATPPGTALCEGFYGGAVGETAQTAIANAMALSNRRAMYVGQADFTDYNAQFVKTIYPGYMAAAIVAGIRAALPPEEPLTHKVVPVLQMNQVLTTAQVQSLANNGVIAIVPNSSGSYIISLGTTTDTSAADYNNLYFVEESVGNAVDQTIMYLVSLLDQTFVGQGNRGSLTTQSLLNAVNGALRDVMDKYGWIAGFTPATTVLPLSSNPTYSVIPVVLQVVEPINGLILNVALEMPLQIASGAAA